MYVTQEIAERIKFLVKERNESIRNMLSEIGLGINAISEFSKGKQLSCVSLAKIADYLNCSVDYLLGRTDVLEVNRRHEASEPFYRDDLQLVAFGGDFKGKPKKKGTQTT